MQLEDDSLWESFPQALEALETLEGTRRYMSCVTEAASFPSFPCAGVLRSSIHRLVGMHPLVVCRPPIDKE